MNTTRHSSRVVEAAPQAYPSADSTDSSMDEFGSEVESASAPETIQPPSAQSPRRRWGTWALAALVAAQLPFVISWVSGSGLLGPAESQLTIESDPAGVEVFIDGRAAGRSPVQLSVAPGARTIELRRDGQSRAFPITLQAGEIVRHRFEFAARAPVPSVGSLLQVSTEPARATVAIDGVPRGISPLSVAGLTPGEHTVTVRSGTSTVARIVQVQAGATATVHVVLPRTPAGPAQGWVQISAAATLDVAEQGQVLGNSNGARLMLTAGDHVLDFSNAELGFRAQQNVRVEPGVGTTISVELPPGVISVNAQPWAEVWVDGERVGETPLGNVSRPLGPHEVVLRHPELGERRFPVVVRLNQPVRVTADLRRSQ